MFSRRHIKQRNVVKVSLQVKLNNREFVFVMKWSQMKETGSDNNY